MLRMFWCSRQLSASASFRGCVLEEDAVHVALHEVAQKLQLQMHMESSSSP